MTYDINTIYTKYKQLTIHYTRSKIKTILSIFIFTSQAHANNTHYCFCLLPQPYDSLVYEC